MRIRGQQSVEITVTEKEVQEIVQRYLLERRLWHRDWWIDPRSNSVMNNLDHHRNIDEFVREATVQDILIDKLYRGVL